MSTKEYQLYLENLGNSLLNFNLREGDATDIIENLTRNGLVLHIWSGLEYANTDLYSESCSFIENIYNHSRKQKKEIPQILGELFLNEVKRRRHKHPIIGLKFPRFLEEKRNLDKLCQYCHYLLRETNSIEQKIDSAWIEKANAKAKITFLNVIYYEN